MLCMSTRLSELGRSWALHYAARSRKAAASLEEMGALSAKSEVIFHFDDENGGAGMDIDAIFASTPHAHTAAIPSPCWQAAQKIPREQVHVKYFSAREEATREGGF